MTQVANIKASGCFQASEWAGKIVESQIYFLQTEKKVVRSIASNPQEAGDRRAFGGEMNDYFFSTILVRGTVKHDPKRWTLIKLEDQKNCSQLRISKCWLPAVRTFRTCQAGLPKDKPDKQDARYADTKIFRFNFQELHQSLLSVQGWSMHRCQVPFSNRQKRQKRWSACRWDLTRWAPAGSSWTVELKSSPLRTTRKNV